VVKKPRTKSFVLKEILIIFVQVSDLESLQSLECGDSVKMRIYMNSEKIQTCDIKMKEYNKSRSYHFKTSYFHQLNVLVMHLGKLYRTP
jgi:hypothetical protein